jgi:hypothetical protein
MSDTQHSTIYMLISFSFSVSPCIIWFNPTFFCKNGRCLHVQLLVSLYFSILLKVEGVALGGSYAQSLSEHTITSQK